MAYFGHFSASQRLIITHQTSHWSYVIPVGSDTPVGTFPRTHIGGGEPILGLSEAIRDGGSTIGDGGSTASEASGRVPEADIHSPNQTIRHVFSQWCLTQPLGTFPRHTIRPGTLSDGALMPWDRTRWEGPRTLPAGPSFYKSHLCWVQSVTPCRKPESEKPRQRVSNSVQKLFAKHFLCL